jgi:hypothetical protein
MAKLVKHDAREERQNESDTLDHFLDTLTLVPVEERDPRDHHHEGGVYVDIDARDPCQFPRPRHDAIMSLNRRTSGTS